MLGVGNRVLVMGIVNVTPDSFSDGGVYFDPADAVAHARRLVNEGADIIDVGAESTRPSAVHVSEEEEWRRLEPVLQALVAELSVPVSVDTYKASVARKAVAMGVQIINDVWGGLADPDMLPMIAETECTYIWMHNRTEPAAGDAVQTLFAETQAGIKRCLRAGIRSDRLWIDPGIGFGKTYEHNLQVLKRLSEYCSLGFPVLLGTSRKSVIGQTLELPPDQRLAGSLATAVLGVQGGVAAVRVHDVAQTVRACRMTEAIVHA